MAHFLEEWTKVEILSEIIHPLRQGFLAPPFPPTPVLPALERGGFGIYFPRRVGQSLTHKSTLRRWLLEKKSGIFLGLGKKTVCYLLRLFKNKFGNSWYILKIYWHHQIHIGMLLVVYLANNQPIPMYIFKLPYYQKIALQKTLIVSWWLEK